MKMRYAICAVLVASVAASCAYADDAFCTNLAQLAKQRNNAAASPDQSFVLPGHVANQAGCRRSLSAGGGSALHCMWSFAYRTDAAMQAFTQILGQMSTCGATQIRQDQSVNHPDFYDLRSYDFPNTTVGVSIKDKGALQQTLIFVTLSAASS
ncbi:MAG: hypothetical protein ABJL67_20800 [Sulfitobacter sp.]